ncbi:MAG: penicillin-binding protein [Actinomycetota bacterium]|nr:penicillin-binding protein [Actinomycetota bacterium]
MEKLQKGGPRPPKATVGMSLGERIKTIPQRRKVRRAAKKRRLSAMSRKRRVWRRVGIIGTWLLGLVALLMVVTVVLFYTLTNVPRPESLTLPQTASILYADGSVMARIYEQNRTIVKLDQVPPQVRWEVLAAEDRGFYSEPGVSIKGTIRAAMSDLSGGYAQGGSGITQQYVKNAYLSNSRTLSRKLKELMIAVKLSRQYSKDQILEFYLNTIYFGRGAYGIEAAAQAYFGVDVSKLSEAQGAVLASSIRSPGYYDPAVNPAAAKARWTYVLDGMVTTGHLTRAREAALTYPKVLRPSSATDAVTGPTALIVNRVLAELQANGISKDDIYARGMHIQTTIDPKAQRAAVSAITQTFANLTPKQRNLKNALVAVNPATGAVLAYYGGPNGTNYAGKPDYVDYAAFGSRPPGSSFKPFTLATALTQTLNKTPGKPHYTIDSQVDGSYTVTIQGRQIQNDPGDESVSGPSVSVRNAMKYSLNTTFDQMAVAVGPNDVAATAHAAGISLTDPNGNPTLVDRGGATGFGIGIGDYPVRPIDQASSFATFANNGVRNSPYFVQKVTDYTGAIVYQHKAAPVKALDPKVANDVTLTLEPIAAYSGFGLTDGRVSAAKTGTEGIFQDPNGNNSDAWTVGFTPQVSAAVWVGSGNSTTPIYNANGGQEYGADLPGRTWSLFVTTYLAGKPALPMATTQQVTGGQNVATPTPSASPTKTATPTPTRSTPAPSVPASTPANSSTPPSPAPSPTPTTCTSGLLKTCPPATGTPAPGG